MRGRLRQWHLAASAALLVSCSTLPYFQSSPREEPCGEPDETGAVRVCPEDRPWCSCASQRCVREVERSQCLTGFAFDSGSCLDVDDVNTIHPSRSDDHASCLLVCEQDAHCDDGAVCNGAEWCDRGTCMPGAPADGLDCDFPGWGDGICRGGRCAPITCGDGVLDPGEECDDGNLVDLDDACRNDCSYRCSRDTDCHDHDPCNGYDHCDPESHLCDGGAFALEEGDECVRQGLVGRCLDQTCVPDTCPNGVRDPGEECDDGNDSSADECLRSCRVNGCGDGEVFLGDEECDDGNLLGGDGCEPDCTWTCLLNADCPSRGICRGCDVSIRSCEGLTLPDGVECQIEGDPARPGTCLSAECEPSGCRDEDGDLYGTGPECLGADCVDTDSSIHPGAVEIPDDGIDQDCSGTDTVTCFVDEDGDGYGSAITVLAPDGDCTDAGESTVDTDCDDTDPSIHPGATEIPDDGIDQDCDGDPRPCFEDRDGDGYGSTVTVVSSDDDCDDPGESRVDTDCDDGDGSMHPGATEVADDGIDQDCSGSDTVTCFADGDIDGFGSISTVLAADGDCTDPGESTLDTDCDDSDGTVHPGGSEIPDDDIDQDCSGTDTVTCFVDADGDGFGSTSTLLASDGDCTDLGESTLDTDCDDAAPMVFPGALEIPDDGIDQDCSGADSVTCFVDADGDGFGSTLTSISPDGDCTDPGESAVDTDCDDAALSVYPGAPEIPGDGIDQDCNGVDAVTCFVDADGDGFGSTVTGIALDGDCLDPGESMLDTDCDDASPIVYPGAPEVPDDGIDQDCSGTDTVTCYVDGDLDGYGSTVTLLAADGDCMDPGESSVDTDCDDVDPVRFPMNPEVCDRKDNDCNFLVDDGRICMTGRQGTTVFAFSPLASSLCADELFNYGGSPSPDITRPDEVVLVLHESTCDGLSFAVFTDDRSNSTTGALEFTQTIVPRAAYTHATFIVNDPGECTYDSGTGVNDCSWTWPAHRHDGVVMASFVADFCMTIRFGARSGVAGVSVYDGAAGTYTPLSFADVELCVTGLP